MARNDQDRQFQLNPDEIARRAKQAEDNAVRQFLTAGFGWEPLDVERHLSRPEGCILARPDGERLCLVEVKWVESGGVGVTLDGGPPAPALLSDLDPRLPDGRARRFPGIPPAVRRDLDDAVRKYRALANDMPEFGGLPYLVVFDHGSHADLHLANRRMPRHREVSGLLLVVRGRSRDDLLRALSINELEQRLESADVTGLPSGEEVEWRLLLNPYALRAVPIPVRATCMIGWPGEAPWPDHIPPGVEEAARAALAALPPNERVVLGAVYDLLGRIDVAQADHAAAGPYLDRLVGMGLATRESATGYQLTERGLTLGLVRDLDRLAE